MSVNNPAPLRISSPSRGALVCGDIDGDGAPDLAAARGRGRRPACSRIIAPNRGHRVSGPPIDPGPCVGDVPSGAEVEYLAAGGVPGRRSSLPAVSYLSAGPPLVHIGLGPVDRIDALDVITGMTSKEAFPMALRIA